ncbi:hypothetical protein COV19_03680 [Candidatus Woesearchaeota archaeon CG10_big_fil_rev_8_21_14_0_10_44_13]|nr:MAG: hypothetical protein COV19_03680 [Candidatus Woesearchaeota archaeon CG10_big_fil_rev_8_21_14_0_10_44_13]
MSAHQDYIEIAGHKWFTTIHRTMSFWHQCLSAYGQYHHAKDFGVNAGLIQLAIISDGINTDLFHYKENEYIYNKAVLKALNSKGKVKALHDRYKRFAKELIDSLNRCNKKLNESNLRDFMRKYRLFCAGLHLTTTIGRQGADLLSEELRKLGADDSEIPKIISSITYPLHHTPLFNSQLDLLKIAMDIQKKKIKQKQADSRLNGWLDKHGPIPINFCGNPWNFEDAENQLKYALKKDCAKEIKSFGIIHKDKLKNAKNTLKTLNNPRVTLLSYILSEGTYLNEYRKNVFSRVSLEFRPMFKKIAGMSGSEDWRDCFYLKPEEFIDIIKGKKISLNNIKHERKIAGLVMGKDGELELLSQGDVQMVMDYLNEMHGRSGSAPRISESYVRGFAASRGIITGKAKIILNTNDFGKLEAGDILITTMTSVDFIPVMEKVAAFVTNEGGITCHASIVSREMNKPCVIGTKIATKIFKDGDLVEVDADKGIVRKIK